MAQLHPLLRVAPTCRQRGPLTLRLLSEAIDHARLLHSGACYSPPFRVTHLQASVQLPCRPMQMLLHQA